MYDIFVRIQNILSCWSRSSLRLRLWRLERGEAGQPASGLFSLTDPFYSSKRHPLQVHVSTHGATLLSSPHEKEVILEQHKAVRTQQHRRKMKCALSHSYHQKNTNNQTYFFRTLQKSINFGNDVNSDVRAMSYVFRKPFDFVGKKYLNFEIFGRYLQKRH